MASKSTDSHLQNVQCKPIRKRQRDRQRERHHHPLRHYSSRTLPSVGLYKYYYRYLVLVVFLFDTSTFHRMSVIQFWYPNASQSQSLHITYGGDSWGSYPTASCDVVVLLQHVEAYTISYNFRYKNPSSMIHTRRHTSQSQVLLKPWTRGPHRYLYGNDHIHDYDQDFFVTTLHNRHPHSHHSPFRCLEHNSAIRVTRQRRQSCLHVKTTIQPEDIAIVTTTTTTTTASATGIIHNHITQPPSPPHLLTLRSLQHDAIPNMIRLLQGLETDANITQRRRSDTSITSTTQQNQSRHLAIVRLGTKWLQQPQPKPKQRILFQNTLPSTFINNNNDDDDDQTSMGTYQVDSNNQLDCTTSSRQLVPGCISTVYVQTTLCHAPAKYCHPNSTIQNDNRIFVQSIEGTADAYLSRGLLACVAKVFQNVSITEILQLNVSQFIQQLSLHTIVLTSDSRNNGFTNLIRTIQAQIQECTSAIQLQQVKVPSSSSSSSSIPPLPVLFVPPTRNDDRNGSVASRVSTSSLSPSQLSETRIVDTNANTTTISPSPPSIFLSTQSPSGMTSASTSSETTTKTRVALLLSGGVDSTVALNLLVRNHHHHDNNQSNVEYDVTAFYLKIWLEDELSDLTVCPWEEDVQYCKAVCEQANVPLEIISLQDEYNDSVLAYTIREAQQGRTPNPDIWCNRRIKFECFYNVIQNRHFDYVATGHYAQVLRTRDVIDGSSTMTTTMTSTVQLHRAPDPIKDQSYFLCALTQEQLQRVLFPIGHLSKATVRQYAEQYQVPNRYRPDSQGLCFLGKVKFDTFLNSYLTDQPGPIVDATSHAILGYHRGLWYHTIGQRKGLGKGLFPNATSMGPWYVVGKNKKTNTVFCTNQFDTDRFTLSRSEFAVEDIHWIAGVPPLSAKILLSNHATGIKRSATSDMAFHLTMKIRHGPNLVQGYLTMDHNNLGSVIDSSLSHLPQSGLVQLQNCKDSGLAPGQYVAFYDNCSTECYGCAVISERNWDGEIDER
jgi:tRNA-5-taurinomethyluridine 2-sulfurtransferase